MIKQRYIIPVLTILLMATVLSAQDMRAWRPAVEINLSYGGNYNLNHLDANLAPGLLIKFLHGDPTKDLLGLGAGIEYLDDQILVPVVLTYLKPVRNLVLIADGGFSFGIWNGIDIMHDYDFDGGLVLGASVGKAIIQLEKMSLIAHLGYDYRTSRLAFNPTGGSGSTIVTNYHYHFITATLSLML